MTRRKQDNLSEDIDLLKRLLKEQTVELDITRERLLLANQVKGEFLSHMSRELRTPLNNIIEYANFLQEQFPEAGGETKGHYLENILENCIRIRRRLRSGVLAPDALQPRGIAVADQPQ